jgi:hypothetical protein
LLFAHVDSLCWKSPISEGRALSPMSLCIVEGSNTYQRSEGDYHNAPVTSVVISVSAQCSLSSVFFGNKSQLLDNFICKYFRLHLYKARALRNITTMPQAHLNIVSMQIYECPINTRSICLVVCIARPLMFLFIWVPSLHNRPYPLPFTC